jgi:hypothetical protein
MYIKKVTKLKSINLKEIKYIKMNKLKVLFEMLNGVNKLKYNEFSNTNYQEKL